MREFLRQVYNVACLLKPKSELRVRFGPEVGAGRSLLAEKAAEPLIASHRFAVDSRPCVVCLSALFSASESSDRT